MTTFPQIGRLLAIAIFGLAMALFRVAMALLGLAMDNFRVAMGIFGGVGDKGCKPIKKTPLPNSPEGVTVAR